MSSNFDWRAEDDATWDEFVSGDPDEKKPNSGGKRPTWLIILGIFVIVSAVGIFAFLQVRRYVENTAASVEEDVLSSHALVKLAAQENDLELLAPLLSGRDPNWTQDQLALLDVDLLLDRQPFGLSWRPEETSGDISVTLSADLQSAEVAYVETYGYGRNGEEGVIQLTQTAVYRLSETRWLLSPPDDDFWGSYITAKGRYVILTFPERDDEVGSRLASDLEAALGGACQRLELGCDEPWPVDVLLATDLDAMMGSGSPEAFAQGDGHLVLPAPTLVGKPANNASYRSFYRGYAAFLLSRLIARQANWECCDQSPFFKALVDIQLGQLGFQPWPVTAEAYRMALRQPVNIDAIRFLWEEGVPLAEALERPDIWMLYSFVEFLLAQQDDLSVFDLQQALTNSDSFNDWISRVGITGSLSLAEDNWRDYLHRRILEVQEEPPVAWPEEDIALICNDGQTGITNVYRYEPAENRWTVELAERDFVVMNNLPDNSGLILTEQYLDVDQLRTTLWRNGQETVVSFGDAFLFSAEIFDPAGRYIVVNIFHSNSSDPGTFDSGPFLLELDNCEPDNCPLSPIDYWPTWSPDGSRTLWVIPRSQNPEAEGNQIFIGDAVLEGGESVATGSNAFWLDEENYAFLNYPQVEVIMAANVNENDPEVLLELADLAVLLPEFEAADLSLTGASTDPVSPGLVFITVANRLENIDYLFTLNWQTGEIKQALELNRSFGGLIIDSFSPNHEWVALRTNATTLSGTSGDSHQLILFNINSQETRSYTLIDDMQMPSGSWSNNGQWAIIRGQDFIILTAPAAGYDHLVRVDSRDCTGVTWLQ